MKLAQCLALSSLLVAGAMMVAQQQQQAPLGDVARQEKPAKKKAARVITDDDMPSHPPDTSAPAASSGAAGSGDTGSAKAPASGEKANAGTKPGKPDSAEVAEMKRRLIELASDEKNLTSRVGELEKAAKDEQDSSRREIINHQLERSRNSLERAKYERDDINKKLEDLKKPKQ